MEKINIISHIVGLILLTGCFSRTAMMDHDQFALIQIGTSMTSLESKVGKPYAIHDKGDGKLEYEYIERIGADGCRVVENHYFLIVVKGEVTGKYVKQEKPPAYDLIYIEDPNHPCYRNP